MFVSCAVLRAGTIGSREVWREGGRERYQERDRDRKREIERDLQLGVRSQPRAQSKDMSMQPLSFSCLMFSIEAF